MEDKETKRKAKDARLKSARQVGLATGIAFLAIGIFLLVLIPISMAMKLLLPLTVFFLMVGITLLITSYKEEWFYPKRTNQS